MSTMQTSCWLSCRKGSDSRHVLRSNNGASNGLHTAVNVVTADETLSHANRDMLQCSQKQTRYALACSSMHAKGLLSSSRVCSALGKCGAALERHLGAAVSKSSRSMRGTKGAKAGNALETVLLCQRWAVRVVLTMLCRSSTLLPRRPRPFCTASAAVSLPSKAAEGTLA